MNKIIVIWVIALTLIQLGSIKEHLAQRAITDMQSKWATSISNTVSLSRQCIEKMGEIMVVKNSYNTQGAMLITPDGTAYIPVIIKDKNTMEKMKTKHQWADKVVDGYYDLEQIYIPKEN